MQNKERRRDEDDEDDDDDEDDEHEKTKEVQQHVPTKGVFQSVAGAHCTVHERSLTVVMALPMVNQHLTH